MKTPYGVDFISITAIFIIVGLMCIFTLNSLDYHEVYGFNSNQYCSSSVMPRFGCRLCITVAYCTFIFA